VRRQPAHVYRRRRAGAATVLVLLVAGVARLFGVGAGGGDEEVQSADTTTTTVATTTTVPPPPDCEERDGTVRQDPLGEWDSVIVDPKRGLPPDFVPEDLVNVAEAGFPLGAAVRSLVIEDLSAMRAAAEENGTPISVIVGFRSHLDQVGLYDRRLDQMGETETRSRVARPGHSEHQLGTAIDVTDQGEDDVDQQWGASPAGQWIAANAPTYGFVLSYPIDAMDRTCFDYEPWHLRYVGRERAEQVLASGRTLREVLYAIERDGVPPTTAPPTPTPTPTVADAGAEGDGT
jgi:zinc D-Ala-D-Ala carboxypeptidase